MIPTTTVPERPFIQNMMLSLTREFWQFWFFQIKHEFVIWFCVLIYNSWYAWTGDETIRQKENERSMISSITKVSRKDMRMAQQAELQKPLPASPDIKTKSSNENKRLWDPSIFEFDNFSQYLVVFDRIITEKDRLRSGVNLRN